jgi:hypothetical protein
MLKIAIVILFIAVIISLSSALKFLLDDMKVEGSKRTAYALGLRITLAGLLLMLIAYGIGTGQLGNNAPWGNHRMITPSENN